MVNREKTHLEMLLAVESGTFLCCCPKKWYELLCFPGKAKKGREILVKMFGKD